MLRPFHGWFSELGLTDIQVRQNDRPAAIHPPYATPAQQALLAQNATSPPWDRENLRRWFILGGGTPEAFDLAFGEVGQSHAREQESIARQVFHAGYGGVTYLVSGRRPGN